MKTKMRLMGLMAITGLMAATAMAQTNNPNVMPPLASVLPTPVVPTSAAALAPTNTPTIGGGLTQIIQAIESGTNVLWEVHGLYAKGLSKKYGGGFGALIPINTYLFASIRLDYVDGGFWMPQGNVGLQLPIPVKLFGTSITVTPFLYGGIAVPVSGATVGSFTIGGSAPIDNDGQPTAIMGAGLAITLYAPWKMDAVGDVEEWTGFPGQQYRFGLTIHL